MVDWRFWHDWFHEKVIAGSYNWLSNVGLNFYVDQRFIDRIANGLGNGTKSLSAAVRTHPERVCALVRLVRVAGCCHHSWIFDFEIVEGQKSEVATFDLSTFDF